MNVLFTGFEPFGELDYNPSWDAAQAAAEAVDGTAVLLPVTFDAAREAPAQARDFDFVVHFGVSSHPDPGVRLERYAHNWWRDDHHEHPERIDEDGPSAVECGLQLGRLARALDGSADLPWVVSHDAGTYVCNATFYHSLVERGPDRAMFIHVPQVDLETAREIGRALAREVDRAGHLHGA